MDFNLVDTQYVYKFKVPIRFINQLHSPFYFKTQRKFSYMQLLITYELNKN